MERKREPRSGRPDLAEGTTRYRLTPLGVAVIGGAALSVLSLARSALATGVLIALVLLLVADALAGRRVIAPTKVGLIVLQPRATSLDGVTVRAIPISGAFEGMEIAMGALGTIRRDQIQHIEGITNQLTLTVAQPANVRFIPFTCRHSALGLVTAAKAFVQITPTRVAAIGQPYDGVMDAKPSDRAVELERLRDYVPGDRPSHIHWMASAKTGQLRVRDDLWQQDEMVIVIEVEGKGPLGLEGSSVGFISGLARLAIQHGWEAGLLVRVISMHDTNDKLLALAETVARNVDAGILLSDFRGRPSAILRDEYVSDEGDMVERIAGIGPGLVARPNGPHYVISKDGLWLAE